MRGLCLLASSLGYVRQSNFSEESSLANWMGGIVGKSRKIFQFLGLNYTTAARNELSMISSVNEHDYTCVKGALVPFCISVGPRSKKTNGNNYLKLSWEFVSCLQVAGRSVRNYSRGNPKGERGSLYSIPIGGAGVRVAVPKCAKMQELKNKC